MMAPRPELTRRRLSRCPGGMLARLLCRRARRRAAHWHAASGRPLGLDLRVLPRQPSGGMQTARRPPSNGPALISRRRGGFFCQTAPRPISRRGVISGTGRLRNTAASIGTNACHRTGNRRNGVPAAVLDNKFGRESRGGQTFLNFAPSFKKHGRAVRVLFEWEAPPDRPCPRTGLFAGVLKAQRR
jgi:hypothetical protein